MSLIIIFGASGYIGSKLLEHTFPNSGVIGLSRYPGHSPLILEYQSEKLKDLISSASNITVINCIQHIPKHDSNSSLTALRGNFIFPKRQLGWIQKTHQRSVRVIQMSSYWENDNLDRGVSNNAYVLAKKSFSLWLRKNSYSFMEIVVGDVLGPDDTRGKLIQVASERFPEPPDSYLKNPQAELRLMKLETVVEFISRNYRSVHGRVELASDWTMTAKQFVENVYSSLGGEQGNLQRERDLQKYLELIRRGKRQSNNLSSNF